MTKTLQTTASIVVINDEDYPSDESYAITREPVHDEKPVIKRFVVISDSMSDRGFMEHLKLAGLIPMDALSGLKGRSPDGRFTNGYSWIDEFVSMLATEYKIAQIRKMATQSGKQYFDQGLGKQAKAHPRYDDIFDGILTGDHKLKVAMGEDADDCPSHQAGMKRSLSDGNIRQGEIINRATPASSEPKTPDFGLDDYLGVTYHGRSWFRTFCQGGMTAHNYAWKPSTSISRFFTRIILATLDGMRRMLLDNDREIGITYQDKQETMVIEWSGANDLITVNREPSILEADNAVSARINNMRKLIHAGYRNFTLINLPDISLTPRYQALSAKKQALASRCTDHFNDILAKACSDMAREYPDCNINVFDINHDFKEIYHNPEQFGFEKAKLKTPYTTSKDFRIGSCLVSLSSIPLHFAALKLPAGYESYYMKVEGDNSALYYVDKTDCIIKHLPIPENNLGIVETTLSGIRQNSLLNKTDYQKLTSLSNYTPREDGGASPSSGYMFWDDVHPSADTHAQNGRHFYEWFTQRFRCTEPDSRLVDLQQESAESILASFRQSYGYRLSRDRSGLFGCLGGHSRLDYTKASLADVFYHAVYDHGNRTKQILTKLGLMDKHYIPIMAIPAVADAMRDVWQRRGLPVDEKSATVTR